MNRPGDASALTAEERAAWVERVKARYAAQRAAGEIEAPPTSPADALAELEDDHRAGRILKWDTRLSAEEKDRM